MAAKHGIVKNGKYYSVLNGVEVEDKMTKIEVDELPVLQEANEHYLYLLKNGSKYEPYLVNDSKTEWVPMSSGGGTWGSITGNIEAQTDLIQKINTTVANAVTDVLNTEV